jgi:hypothetical protein
LLQRLDCRSATAAIRQLTCPKLSNLTMPVQGIVRDTGITFQ